MSRPLKTNKPVREAIKLTGLKQYEIANKLGFTEYGFSKRLRVELPKDEQRDLVKAIVSLA